MSMNLRSLESTLPFEKKAVLGVTLKKNPDPDYNFYDIENFDKFLLIIITLSN